MTRPVLPRSLTTLSLHDLRMRFEKPNSSNRWDKPLFYVDMTPPKAQNSGPSEEKEKKETAPQSDVEQELKSDLGMVQVVSTPLEASLDPAPVTVFSSWKSAKKSSSSQSVITTSTALQESDQQRGVYFSGNKVSDVNSEENRAEATRTPDMVIDDIISYFETAVAPAPNLATKPVRHAGPELLYQLDRVSQTIVQLITSHQQEHTDGTPLILKDFDSHLLTLPRYVGAQELQRLRRQFVKMNSSHPPESSTDVGGKFVEFLRNQIV
jgi:tRNA uridine 5-carbamoylmethylation protein Kti12